jgi:prepilin-type N-terminal cleavage/methylation domain-containing protein
MDRARGLNRLAKARGFTLVELMIVVVVIAILSALGVYGVRKYILASKTSEATEMLGAIRAAQEAYKADTFVYRATVGDPPNEKELTGSANSYPGFYPRSAPLRRAKATWEGGNATIKARWDELGVSTTSPVNYIYGCAVGGANDVPASPQAVLIYDATTNIHGFRNYPSAAVGRPWFLCKAVADLDGNNTNGEWAYSSLVDEVAHTGEKEE